jgi:hypothetical protein
VSSGMMLPERATFEPSVTPQPPIRNGTAVSRGGVDVSCDVTRAVTCEITMMPAQRGADTVPMI